MTHHFHHHARFYLAGLVGVGAWLGATAGGLEPASLRLVTAGDAFFTVYLAATAILALPDSPAEMRRAASYEDEGITAILVITLAVVGMSVAAIFSLVNDPKLAAWERALALASVPLGWLTLHTVAAFRYAHLYYAPSEGRGAKHRDARGLAFPRTDEPAASDFLYFALVIGMTAQTSDVQVETTSMRRVTSVHAFVSFFFNTVLLALAVNIAGTYARGAGG